MEHKANASGEVPGEYTELVRQAGEFARAGDLKQALATYERSIAVYPQGIDAWHEKAGILNKLGRHEEALEALETVINLRVKQELAEYGGMNFLGRWGQRRLDGTRRPPPQKKPQKEKRQD
jgi:tetratricopeptide (TPR) repeat protein